MITSKNKQVEVRPHYHHSQVAGRGPVMITSKNKQIDKDKAKTRQGKDKQKPHHHHSQVAATQPDALRRAVAVGGAGPGAPLQGGSVPLGQVAAGGWWPGAWGVCLLSDMCVRCGPPTPHALCPWVMAG